MLCDSNVLIYAAEPGETRFDPWVQHPEACLASVTRIEVLGFPGFAALDAARQARLETLVGSLVELELDRQVAERAIALRRERKMTLADSVIAATALEYGVPLVTQNVEDFKHVQGLRVINPFEVV
ncbi:MAG: type II toxin-antitoxin system VapC family toxin [Verrucomicrobia bacterium]|nr:type II toxin-antitoxin system VapC family toxin [Verrucomicrobiota bacterium]